MHVVITQRKDGEVREIDVELTRTNLTALLAKLDGNPPNSACTIFKMIDDRYICVKAVEDAEHYSDRRRGRMHSDTERAMRDNDCGAGQWDGS